MEIHYQGKKYNLSRNKYKKFRHRCESNRFTSKENHIWLSKMEEIYKENKDCKLINNNQDDKKTVKISILYLVLFLILIILGLLIYNYFFELICFIGIAGMACKMLVKWHEFDEF